jgi:phage shock protein PspC (stress-responsive transcriptional regulator)
MHNTQRQFDAPLPGTSAVGTSAVGDDPSRNTPPSTPRFTPARAPKRLYRNPDGPIGGVATGIADYLGLDPVILRLAFLLAALSGFGLAAYLVCWVVIPKGERPRRQLAQPGSVQESH